ncbi:MAG: XdhC family protein [Proteobacteria bacterium]|nr:XdhC family protein [Pseudomonadota bacterium]
MEHFLIHVRQVLGEARAAVVATIIKQAGAAPRHLGTRMLITADGAGLGTIGGGLIEAQVMAAAGDVLASGRPRALEFHLTGQDAAETDMLCGGHVTISLNPVPAGDENLSRVVDEVDRTLAAGGSGLLIEAVGPKAAGDRWLFIDRDGALCGDPGSDALRDEIGRRAPEWLGAEEPFLLPGAGLPDQTGDLFVTPIIIRHRMILFGGGHVSLHVARLAKMVGFWLVVADDRPEFANAARFPEADEVWAEEFDGILEGRTVTPNDYLVIITRGHLHDLSVLHQALRTPAEYLGMIGSRRKREVIFKKLREWGVAESDIARVHSPIGLDIGAETPEEIAVSIVAELIAFRATKVRRQKDWHV